jgi:membrane associated rhomboid family serine protease
MRNKSSKIFFSILYPAIFVVILWIIRIYEDVENINLSWYGLYPRSIHGLTGILFSPLLHADYNHLWANTVPLLTLGPIILFFYRPIAFQIFFWVYLMTGLWVWAAARSSYHIGASGIIYGFITFLFFSGIFRKDTRLLALSLLITFLYGSAIWGVLPIENGTSWESHLLGSLAGFITAYHFRKEGPPPRKYDLEDDGNELDDAVDENTKESGDTPYEENNYQ